MPGSLAARSTVTLFFDGKTFLKEAQEESRRKDNVQWIMDSGWGIHWKTSHDRREEAANRRVSGPLVNWVAEVTVSQWLCDVTFIAQKMFVPSIGDAHHSIGYLAFGGPNHFLHHRRRQKPRVMELWFHSPFPFIARCHLRFCNQYNWVNQENCDDILG